MIINSVMKLSENIKKMLIVVFIFISAFIVLIPNIEVWNMAYLKNTDTFHVIVSILNTLFGGGSIYVIQKIFRNKFLKK